LALASRSRLARIGYDLVLCGPRVQAVADAIAKLEAAAASALRESELQTPAARRDLVESSQGRFGRLTWLANKGYCLRELAQHSGSHEESFDEVSHQLRGPLLLTQTVARWSDVQRKPTPRFGDAW